ncbi:MAG: gliding motility-associated C-terminal domain-containing protein [Bacteroidetes bacterium]|nr:gliding motility-associated C-terminal domain-containing protein [Bacteroidota bacterium]
MKKIYALFLLYLCTHALQAQTVFWAETFSVGTSCPGNQGTLANGFVSSNGTWATSATGVNNAFANTWYVSQTEAGQTPTSCGQRCIDNNPTLTNRTLHIGNVPGSPNAAAFCPTGDCGARYDFGVGTNKVTTHLRAESPAISCLAKSGITLQFDYITRRYPGDSLTVWYFDGALWSTLMVPAATPTCAGAIAGDTSGTWTTQAAITLPASANNNAQVKIGFEWANNDDGKGGNPSVAIDNIKLSATTLGGGPSTLTVTIVPPDTVSATPLYCTNTPYHFTGKANPGPILFYQWKSYPAPPQVLFNPNPPFQNGVDISFTLPGTYTLVLVANSQFNGLDSTQLVLTVKPTPTITASPLNAMVCLNGTGTNLYVTGAGTGGTYTWTTSGATLPPTYFPTDPNADSVNVNPVPAPNTWATYTVVGTSTVGCVSAPVAVTVTIAPAPTPQYILAPDSVCSGSFVIMSVAGMPVTTTYTWSAPAAGGLGTNSGSSAQATPIYSGMTDTTFTYYSQINVPGCPSYSLHPVNVVVQPTPKVKLLSDTVDNCNNMGALLSTTCTPSGVATYSWTPNYHLSSTTGSTVTATPTVPTKYYVTATLNGCISKKDSVLVRVGDTVNAAISSENQVICSGQKNQFIGFPQNGPLNHSYTYQWQPSVSIISTSIGGDTIETQPIMPSSGTGVIYTLTVRGTCVKHNIATYQLYINNCTPPNPSFTASSHTICRQHCIIYRDSTQYTSTKPLQYKWIFVGGSINPVTGGTVSGDTLFYNLNHNNPLPPVKVCYPITSYGNTHGSTVSNNFPVIEMVTSGSYSATAIDSVNVMKAPVANAGTSQTVQEGTPITLSGSASQGSANNGYGQITSYQWAQSDSCLISCYSCMNTVVTPTTTTNYTLTVMDNNGCASQAVVTVYVDVVCMSVFIANAFSPNGDGLNDVLHVKSNCGMTSMAFRIYDRWGEKVFESADLNYGWDGTYKGKPVDSGVFIYTLDGFLSNGNEVKKKGNVTLMR